MKLAVFGAAGQLGRALVRVAAAEGVTVAAFDRATADITNAPAVRAALASAAADAVINAAAYTAVDKAESEPERAFAVNRDGARTLAAEAARLNLPLIQVSTDYVFDGTKVEPYDEWDPTAPQSVYGHSKRGGELELGPEDTVVRTSWVCGRFGANMVGTILRLAAQPGPLRFVDDQRGHPTFADDLAAMIARLVTERRQGLFHVTNQGAVSWYEFARSVLAAAGDDPARVAPIATIDLDPFRPAPRPANSVLDNAALRLSGIPLLDHHEVPLQRLVDHLLG